jgi:hypothetical protein
MCRIDTLFKEISNRSLAAKHALWKGDLCLADDLINDNYFAALDARAEIEANRYASHIGINAYRDKRLSASNNASSVIADLTYTTAKQTKARSDFYAKSGPGINLTTGSTETSRGSSSSSASSGYGQPFFSGHVPTHQRPAQPAHLHGNGRRSGHGSADYWSCSELPETQTTQEVRDYRRAHPSDRPERA